MLDLSHSKSKRADLLAVALSLAGLAGLTVSAGGLLGGPGLWPSFSGAAVYTAHLSPADVETHTPHTATYAPPRQPASDNLTLRVINEAARGVCQSEARRQTPADASRRQRRSRAAARRPVTLLTATTSGRPTNS